LRHVSADAGRPVLNFEGKWVADVVFGYNSESLDRDGNDYLENLRETVDLYEDQKKMIPFGGDLYKGVAVTRSNESLNDEVAAIVAKVLGRFIQTITPKIDDRYRSRGTSGTS
jgi:hypothetical protein